MDRFSFAAAHAALAQGQTATAIEVSLGGVIIECLDGAVSVAVTGGHFRIIAAGKESSGWGVHTLHAGDKLSVRAGDWGSWAYIAFAGQLAAKSWLGHTATHALSGFGGGTLSTNDVLDVSDAQVLDSRSGDIPIPDFAKPTPDVQTVLGPQDHHFTSKALAQFQASEFTFTDAFDRMGAKLHGPALMMNDALSIPSEPIIRGSVQVSGDGAPTVLLADHQTTGGYPKIATLLSSETDRFAQNRSGDRVRFGCLSPEGALADSRKFSATVSAYLSALAKPKASLDERLMTLNLIDGAVSGTED